jgi:propanediol utilization protein
MALLLCVPLLCCRHVLELPVRNSTRVDLIKHDEDLDGFAVTVTSSSSSSGGMGETEVLYARKVVLATGIQVGGPEQRLVQAKACLQGASRTGDIVARRHVHSQHEWDCLPE